MYRHEYCIIAQFSRTLNPEDALRSPFAANIKQPMNLHLHLHGQNLKRSHQEAAPVDMNYAAIGERTAGNGYDDSGNLFRRPNCLGQQLF